MAFMYRRRSLQAAVRLRSFKSGTSIALALVAASGAQAGQLQQFDYLCHGSERYVDGGTGLPPRPVTQLYRIDLTRGLWCSARCERTRRIESFDDLRIVLSSAQEAELSDHITLDRIDQRIDYSTGAGYGSGFRGFVGRVTCRTKPFTTFAPPAY